MKDLIEKKVIRPSDKRNAVLYLVMEHRLSAQRSCNSMGISRVTVADGQTLIVILKSLHQIMVS